MGVRVAKTTWILVASRSGARVYEHLGPNRGMQLLETIDHADGRLRNGDIDADKAGRHYDRHGRGGHGLGRHESPTEHLAQGFAKNLAGSLGEARAAERFDQLVLVAAPRLLGMLRDSLDPSTAGRVIGSIDKDFSAGDTLHLTKSLEAVLPI